MCKNEIRPREVVVQAHTCLLVKITLHFRRFCAFSSIGNKLGISDIKCQCNVFLFSIFLKIAELQL